MGIDGAADLLFPVGQGDKGRLERASAALADGLIQVNRKLGVAATLNRVGSMFTSFFTAGPVTCFNDTKSADTARFGAYFRAMLEEGVYLAPSQFEAAFVSLAHGEQEIRSTVDAHERALKKIL